MYRSEAQVRVAEGIAPEASIRLSRKTPILHPGCIVSIVVRGYIELTRRKASLFFVFGRI